MLIFGVRGVAIAPVAVSEFVATVRDAAAEWADEPSAPMHQREGAPQGLEAALGVALSVWLDRVAQASGSEAVEAVRWR